MRARPDPLLPLLASAVSVLVLGSIVLFFYPRVSRLLESSRDSVVGRPPSPEVSVPVWVARTEDGIALLLRPGAGPERDAGLDEALGGGVLHYLTLRVYNFGRSEPYAIELPAAGFASPEGGAPALPAASLMVPSAPARLVPILRGLGAVPRLRVAPGEFGQALLVSRDDPARRTAFLSGALKLERREVTRRRLAAWEARPDWESFKDF